MRHLAQLTQWLRVHELMDASVEERLRLLQEQLKGDKILVAFVAEFSRGKSELINALFFADYGRRIMPASAGRTTMCPTEIGYDRDLPACLRLLPIRTRLQAPGLAEWRLNAQAWERVDLQVDDAVQMAQALEMVAQVRRVSIDEARALGFWDDAGGDDNPVRGSDGLVEVPMWRHAIINIPHPLLKQGLVILDTPGLNAVGAEPELTINLIPQAHAVVFILGADTGVTRSDLAIWRNHLGVTEDASETRLVVLNKIDTLWDALRSPAQVQEQVERQCSSSAHMLGMPAQRVVPVSAHKALLAKIGRDDVLLRASGIAQLEQALTDSLLARRQEILHAMVARDLAGLHEEVTRLINVRRRDLDEQVLELGSLKGKNSTVIGAMRRRIEQEQREFDASAAKISALRAVLLKMLHPLFRQLGPRHVKTRLLALSTALQGKGLKLGVRKVYDETFDALHAQLQALQGSAQEIHDMLGGTFGQLNAEFGFSLQAPALPPLAAHVDELEGIRQRHLQYVGMGSALRLAQPQFVQRLLRALELRLRTVFEAAATDLQAWGKAATAQLDVQMRERKRNFARRIEAVDRIQQAAGGLVERLAQLEQAQALLWKTQAQLQEMTVQLQLMQGPQLPPMPPRDKLPTQAPAREPGVDFDVTVPMQLPA
ncbi:hypothetical protein GCM10022279_17740 [Comamonas faecalis]|uniref:Dynamin N-terminal domain-containing protein n=1 Tax=Comamonas faecalis TaxID=1387849 RepID=A0ABP7RBE1_9BURK